MKLAYNKNVWNVLIVDENQYIYSVPEMTAQNVKVLENKIWKTFFN
jgi:hypothetical protein